MTTRTEYWENRKKGLLPDSLFNTFRFFVEVILPGVGALYFALAEIWNLPNAAQVVATLSAVAVFLGLFVNYARIKHSEVNENLVDGELVIDLNDPMKDTYSIEIHRPLGELPLQNEVRLKVRNNDTVG